MSSLPFSLSDNTALLGLYKYLQQTRGIRCCLFPDPHFAQIAFSIDSQWAWASSRNWEEICMHQHLFHGEEWCSSIHTAALPLPLVQLGAFFLIKSVWWWTEEGGLKRCRTVVEVVRCTTSGFWWNQYSHMSLYSFSKWDGRLSCPLAKGIAR